MRVITIAFVGGVETEQAQMASVPTEMCIREEPRLAQRLGSHTCDRSDVERFEHRIDRDSVAVADTIREIHGLAVDNHQIHFGMRNARRFDQVLDRGLSIEAAHDGHEAVPPRQEIIQLGVEAKLRTLHVHRPSHPRHLECSRYAINAGSIERPTLRKLMATSMSALDLAT